MSRRKTKNVKHVEYISIEQHYHGVWWRLSNFFVLLSMVVANMIAEHFGYDFRFSEFMMLVALIGVLGYDLYDLYDKLKGLKSMLGGKKK